MAKKFYLSSTSAPYTPATIRGAWDDTGGAVVSALDGNVITYLPHLQASIARAETNTSTTYDVLLYRGVTGPLEAQTLSGTFDVGIWPLESATDADFYWHIHVYVTQGDSDTPRGTILSDYVENTTNEWPSGSSALRNLQSAQAITSLAISAGDRIIVEIGYIARNSTASSRTGTFWYNDGNYVEFSMDIVESVMPHRITQVVAEMLSEGDESQRITQVVAEMISEGDESQRITQLVAEIINEGDETQRITQFVVEVFHVRHPFPPLTLVG